MSKVLSQNLTGPQEHTKLFLLQQPSLPLSYGYEHGKICNLHSPRPRLVTDITLYTIVDEELPLVLLGDWNLNLLQIADFHSSISASNFKLHQRAEPVSN